MVGVMSMLMSGGTTTGQRSCAAEVNVEGTGSSAAPTMVRGKEAVKVPTRLQVEVGRTMVSWPVTVQRVPSTGLAPQEGEPRLEEVEVAASACGGVNVGGEISTGAVYDAVLLCFHDETK